MYCAANTYFYLIRAHISLFVRVPFSSVYLYVNLRAPVCLYVNIRGFGPCTRICPFVNVLVSPVCLSVNLHVFGPHFSVRMPLSLVRRGLPLNPNTLLQWDDDSIVCRAIVLVISKATTAA